MSQAQHIAKLATYLNSLEEALSEGNPADVLAFLRVLRMNGLDDATSSYFTMAFAHAPRPAHFDQVMQWIADHRQVLASQASESEDVADEFDFDDFVAVADGLWAVSELEGLSDADSDMAAFVSVTEDDVEVAEFPLDDFSLQEDAALGSSAEDNPFAAFEELDDVAIDVSDAEDASGVFGAFREVSSFASVDDLSSGDSISDPFADLKDGPILSDSSPKESSDPFFDFDSSPEQAMPSASSTFTGEREKTLQLDQNHLQALSEASSRAELVESSEVPAEAPTTEYKQEHASANLQHQGLGDDDSSPSAPVTDEALQSQPTRQQFKVGFTEATQVSTSTLAESTKSPDEDDFDFDLGPADPSARQQVEPSVDEKIAYASPPSGDSCFPAPITSDDEEDGAFFPPPITSDTHGSQKDDVDFIAPEDNSFFPPPLAPESQQIDDGYVEPEGESFFPPPLSGNNSPPEDAVEATTDHSSSPSPFPHAPSTAGQFPAAPEEASLELSEPSAPASAFRSHQARPSQPTPVFHGREAEELRDREPTPAPGVEPVSSEEQALAADELLALGEELSSGSSSRPPRQRTKSTPSYRGEPMVRELGNELTPDQPPHPQTPTGRFSASQNGPEDTNPFAQQMPTGVGADPVGVVDQSSFVLEEMEASNPKITDPIQAIHAALDQARAHYERGEFEDAMILIEDVLEVDESSQRAHELKNIVEGELERILADSLGAMSATPALAISMGEIPSLDLDHRAGFLISQIDGMLTFEDILDMSAMSRLETLTVLVDLRAQGVISSD